MFSTILRLDIIIYNEMLNLHKYSPEYIKLFQIESIRLNKILNNTCLVEHIGSTAIPGVDGKGVIDIMLVFDNEIDIKYATKLLENDGYFSSSDNIKRSGRVFMSSAGTKDSNEGDIHLHLLTRNNIDYINAIMFRNYLINHQDTKRLYIELKYELFNKVNGNRKEYTKLKDVFIKNIINLAQNEKYINDRN